MSFAEPLLLWLAVVAPLAATLAAWRWRRRFAAEAAWVARGLWTRLRVGGQPRALALVVGLPALALLAIALGLARPRWGSVTEQVERQGVDVIFVLDSSQSMAAGDVTPSRFWVAGSLVRRMVAALPGDRVALVQAEGTGVVLAPLTVDAAAIDLVLDGVEPGSAPLPGTRLAPALERALGLFPEGGRQHRAIVIASDGEIHGEALAAVARKLSEAGVVTHALAIGTASGAPVPQGGGPGEFKRGRDGRVVVSRLHRESLAELARATGGTLVDVESADADPGPIVRRLQAMARRAIDTETVSTLEERFQWPLAAATAALALALALSPFRSRAAEASR